MPRLCGRTKGMSGFWSVTRYNDIKEVELAHRVFSSQRGSINMMVADRKLWKPEKLALQRLTP